jgi:large subunit ribosomal protein L6
MFSKKIQCPNNIIIKLAIIDQQRFLILSSNNIMSIPQYIFIPTDISISKTGPFLNFIDNKIQNSDFTQFTEKISALIKQLQFFVRKKLNLKGLGLKAKINTVENILELKLGLSHLVKIRIPKTLRIIVVKTTIIIKGFSIFEVFNFAFKLRLLKKPNIYKGKGIFYKKEKLTLKLIKKT